MHCERKIKLRSPKTSYYLIEVVTKAGLTVYIYMIIICYSGARQCIKYHINGLGLVSINLKVEIWHYIPGMKVFRRSADFRSEILMIQYKLCCFKVFNILYINNLVNPYMVLFLSIGFNIWRQKTWFLDLQLQPYT